MELPQISPGACDQWRVWPRPPRSAEGRWKVLVQTCDGVEPPAASAGVLVAGRRGTTCFQQSELWRTELTLVRPKARTEAHPSVWPVGSWAHRVSQHRVSLSLWSSANSTPPYPLSTESSQTLVHFRSSRVNHWLESLRSIRLNCFTTQRRVCVICFFSKWFFRLLL